MQSLTAPLQGFLNAIVYGWTREEFFKAITNKRINSEVSVSRAANEGDSLLNSGEQVVVRSAIERDREHEKRRRVSTDSGVFHSYQHHSS